MTQTCFSSVTFFYVRFLLKLGQLAIQRPSHLSGRSNNGRSFILVVLVVVVGVGVVVVVVELLVQVTIVVVGSIGGPGSSTSSSSSSCSSSSNSRCSILKSWSGDSEDSGCSALFSRSKASG